MAFVCKGHVTNHQRWSISYQHAKFEQNQSINTKVTFLKATAAFIWPLIVKAAAPTLTLKVLINFGVGLVTGYERILTNFNKKVKTDDDDDDDDHDDRGREVVQDQPGGW